ncbi:hypothetical protein E4U58_003166 [Claviceps cyperi]|nr:hypothetical protein E4U58_003166 [Claviceps cyperi]
MSKNAAAARPPHVKNKEVGTVANGGIYDIRARDPLQTPSSAKYAARDRQSDDEGDHILPVEGV